MTADPSPVRAARQEDRAAFLAMWEDFISLDPGEPGNRAMGDVNWARLIDPGHPLRCLIGVDEDNVPRGFVLYLALPFTWSAGDICYLQDLYVHPDARGTGLARAIVDALTAIGREQGWYKVFWMTQHHNVAAQRFYDKFAERKDYVRYDLTIGTP
ncbi:GNAT family N-acetyltransferase [Microbaculum marinum]|uniref:GNAT family N-acetyltransferase n=1 Tax=Microbaculum marinum TaxID=1764581 RepID=A0AAW9RME3_9HYPH